MVAFEQARGRPIREGLQINHLCNRPFCIQPAHLYEGTAQENSEDRQAELADGLYPTWQAMAYRLDRALTRHHWEAPTLEAVSTSMDPSLECPHVELPGMFEKARGNGGRRHCANCLEEIVLQEGAELRVRQPCRMSQPCRCDGEKDKRVPKT